MTTASPCSFASASRVHVYRQVDVADATIAAEVFTYRSGEATVSKTRQEKTLSLRGKAMEQRRPRDRVMDIFYAISRGVNGVTASETLLVVVREEERE